MLERLKAMHWAIMLAVMLLVGGAAVYGFHYLFLSGIVAETQTLAGELEQLRTKNRQVNAAQTSLNDFKAKFDQLKLEYEQSKQLLPESVEISRVLEQVQLLAKNRLRIEKFEPDKEDEEMEFYKLRKVRVAVTGTYPRLQDFFQQMADLKRIVNITNAEIRGASPQRENLSLEANFTVSALYANPEDINNLKPPAPKTEKDKSKPAEPAARPANKEEKAMRGLEIN
ncbi:MAG: type 4a pilus biogenesis protein PilO [Blastocatellia bacterium]